MMVGNVFSKNVYSDKNEAGEKKRENFIPQLYWKQKQKSGDGTEKWFVLKYTMFLNDKPKNTTKRLK